MGPWLYQAVVAQSPEIAAAMDEARVTFVDCTWEETDDRGMATRWRLATLSFPAIGDDSLAYRLTATLDAGMVAMDLTLIRRGGLISVLFNAAAGLFGPASVDSDLTERMARRVDALMIAAQ